MIADANTGWLMHEAARVVRAVRDVDVYIEQPCLTYEECLAIRRRTDHPFVLDETIDGIDILMRGHADRAMDVCGCLLSAVAAVIGSGDLFRMACIFISYCTLPKYCFVR